MHISERGFLSTAFRRARHFSKIKQRQLLFCELTAKAIAKKLKVDGKGWFLRLVTCQKSGNKYRNTVPVISVADCQQWRNSATQWLIGQTPSVVPSISLVFKY